MKNTVKKMLVVAGLLLAGIGTVMADTTLPAGYRVAVVDVNAVVSKSSQVKALKADQQKKLVELQKWLETVRSDVQKQATKEGKEKLIAKYDAEFAKKQEALKKDYASKLEAIDKSISKTITEQAKAQNYNLIFAKGVVLYGGDDITGSIIKAVK